ncbi:uncharacterized protein LOC108198462 isoform X2 [Daucus carota subsp. sativus]|uniref:uncharacterized protein LOC108198462 isoform X2 n=1 Tax=Daucus carota subsp. sativus TaxID=79200 RepID=UPI0030832AEB
MIRKEFMERSLAEVEEKSNKEDSIMSEEASCWNDSLKTQCSVSSEGMNFGVNGIKLFYFKGTIMTISKDRVKPSPLPDSWKLAEIFTTGIVLGSYLAMMTVIFFWAAYKTNFFPVIQKMDLN